MSLAQSMGNMFELNVQKTLEAYTTTARDFLALFYKLSTTLITALRCSTLVNMVVITIAVSLFTATSEDILKITRIISNNHGQLKGVILTPYPYFVLGDKIFPLKTWLMRPHPGKLAQQERVFNYRLSRARRVIDNCFGILAARWRTFSAPIEASVTDVERYLLAYIALHNYLHQTDHPSYCPNSFVDCEDSKRGIKEEELRKIGTERNGVLANLHNVRGSLYMERVKERDK